MPDDLRNPEAAAALAASTIAKARRKRTNSSPNTGSMGSTGSSTLEPAGGLGFSESDTGTRGDDGAGSMGSAPAPLPDGFRMNARGLWFDFPVSERNPEGSSLLIAGPFEVIGQTRDDASENWGTLLRWRDHDGHPHEWAIPNTLLHEHGDPIGKELARKGLDCTPNGQAPGLLRQFLSTVQTTRRLRCVARTGWHHADAGPVFVIPGDGGGFAFGRGGREIVLQTEHATGAAQFREVGTLDAWRDGVAARCVGNDRLGLFLASAFAGPLLDVLGEPSGGVHLVGDSRSGKSTAAAVAASVWGKPSSDGQIRQWRGTANGLEAIAAETTDALLILDEMGQADAREVGDIVYMLANEAGKNRAARNGSARRRQVWRVLFLSTGEISLAVKMGEANQQARAGLEVRLVNVPADAGAGMGVFQELHGQTGPAALADALKDAARANYGNAARAFLSRLAEDRAASPAELRETLAALRQRFLADHLPAGASGQVRSVANRFSLIAGAGELAREYGVLPWPLGEAARAAGACFKSWLAMRGGAGSGEDALALGQVRKFIEAHGESRFTALWGATPHSEPATVGETRTVNRAGFRRRMDGGGWEFMVFPETWGSEVCKGVDPKRTAELLKAKGWLLGATERHRSAPVTIPGEGKVRLYRISGAILAGDDQTEGRDDVPS